MSTKTGSAPWNRIGFTEAMHDSESPLHQLRARYGEILGGRPEVQEWDVGVVHRARRAR